MSLHNRIKKVKSSLRNSIPFMSAPFICEHYLDSAGVFDDSDRTAFEDWVFRNRHKLNIRWMGYASRAECRAYVRRDLSESLYMHRVSVAFLIESPNKVHDVLTSTQNINYF